MERKNPINNEPVSPIKTLDGAQLKFRKANKAPVMANEINAKASKPVKKNHTPKNIEAITPMLPAKPSMPSAKLKAFVITIIVNTEIK